ncbi:MAG: serine/threonine protein kinase [Proteobacteria bacterium]|nr:serine/threonine protein kinase [Pseudomonadota bacterium]
MTLPGQGDDRSDALAVLARSALSGEASPEATLWDSIDLNDPEDRRFGDYELLERIGRGGMGVVFRAYQSSLGREVAVKFIVGPLARDTAAVERFIAEARAAARLHHPHIVPVYEVASVEGMHCFSMPLLRGQTLAQRIAGKRLDTATSVDLMLKIGAAVAYAHSLGLLHLDLKPSNMLFDEHGLPLIGDFGLARHVDADGFVTPVGTWGTPAYMAPEQIARQRLDVRTDVHALGAIFYELLTGDGPRGSASTTRAEVEHVAMLPVRPPHAIDPAIDRDLEAICLRCLHGDPAQRYSSVGELLADLSRWRNGEPVTARVRGWRERALRGLRRHPAAVASAIAVAMALVLGLATTSWQWQRAERAQRMASAQALRTRQLAGLMAAAFPAGNARYDQQVDSAHAAVAWLKRNVGNDPVAQREVLAAFRQALVAAHKGDAVTALLNEILDQLGQGYRERQVQRLAAKGDRDSLIAAALIGIPRGDTASSPAHEAVLQRLFEHYPGDELALYAIALACNVQAQPCAHGDYVRRLTARFPDNSTHWLLMPNGDAADSATYAVQILHAADAAHADDHLMAITTLLRAALRGEPVPESIGQPIKAMVGEAEESSTLLHNTVGSVPLPMYRGVMNTCRPTSDAMRQYPGLRDACGRFATIAMRSPDTSILSKMITSSIVRRLYKGRPLETEGKQYRRDYVWMSLFVMNGELPRDPEALQQDVARYGEWEAWRRQTVRFGGAATPPPDWIPADPQDLLLSEERTPQKSK